MINLKILSTEELTYRTFRDIQWLQADNFYSTAEPKEQSWCYSSSPEISTATSYMFKLQGPSKDGSHHVSQVCTNHVDVP